MTNICLICLCTDGHIEDPGILNWLCNIFQVCDYDLIGGGDPIGKVFLGWNQSKTYKPGFKHWKEVLENPRRPIIKWHVLQDPEPEEEEDPKEKKKKEKEEKEKKGKNDKEKFYQWTH